ncbi:MAG: A/G-specific adenine glycosylase [Prolixibacteraceae bacterium]
MQNFANSLIYWFEGQKRDLPWRKKRSSYHVWISEIILQQTKVAQGNSYFKRFIELFPDIKTLAKAQEREVLKAWEGLGYYSRARNLHASAKQIMDKYDGIFPTSYKDIISLKGVGPYTAGAILSFSQNLPYPAIDGNTIRVISRIFEIDTPSHIKETTKQMECIIKELYKYGSPREVNEAIIELGALICSPKNPQCKLCPISDTCIAYNKNIIDKLPVIKKKTPPKTRELNFLIIDGPDNTTYIEERSGKDIWKGLYTPMMIEENNMDRLTKQVGLIIEGVKKIHKFDYIEHKLTHQTLKITIWRGSTEIKSSHLIPKEEIKEFPTAKPFIELFKKSMN